MNYAAVPQVARDDNADVLDQSEKEYNRMISQHMTYHKLLMDDLMKLSTETGSSNNLIQRQLNQGNQTNVIRGLASTINNLDTTNQHLVASASGFKADTSNTAQKVSRFQDFLMENTSKLNEYVDAYQALVNDNDNNNNNNLKGTGTNNNDNLKGTNTNTKTKEGFATNTHTMDAALEVSARMKESHKYMLVVIGLVSLYALYKTVKQLWMNSNE